ncbi:MAG: hypothetical protein KDI36_00680 [Pseudomonadales bacterium]|nr:hypothetical protein [Pseudomonadales bacterium]
MAILLISTILSIMTACLVWLFAGSHLPPGETEKWPVMNNIAWYAVGAFLPIFLIIFFTN